MSPGDDDANDGSSETSVTVEDGSSLQVAETSAATEADVRDDAEPSSAAGLEAATPAGNLEALLAFATAESADLREQLLRRKVEFDNFRRRVERERQEVAEDARAEVLQQLLPALDNLERAQRLGGDEGSILRGIEMVYGELQKALGLLGVRSHEPLGEAFDPLSQQALLYEEVPGFEDGTVVEVYRRSYHLGDRLLRPAMVKVAKGEESNEDDSDEGATR